jgi:putative inorganic carbon (HCO3(-)) transporter
MTSFGNIKKLYAFSAIFIVASIAALIFEFYFILLFPLVLAFGFVLVTKPTYILYFLAFSTPLSVHLIEERISTINLSMPTEPLIILMFVGVLLLLVKSKTLNHAELKTALSILILADFTWLIVTSITSEMPLISAKYVMSKAWYLVVFYFLLTKVFKNERVAKIFVWSFIVACFILASYTLFNHAQGSFTRNYAYTAMRPFLPDHGMYAACISFVVPVLFVFTFHGSKFNYSLPFRMVCFGLLLFFIFAVALSFTRASWLSLVIAIGVYFLLRIKFNFKFLVPLVLVVVGVVFANIDSLLTDLSRNKKESDDNIENHLQSVSNVSSDPSNLERLNRWGSGIRMWEERPVVGFGPGTYTFMYGTRQLPHEMTIISTNAGSLGGIHSEYLRPLAESGTLGLLFIVCIAFTVFSLGFKHNRTLTGQSKYLSMAVFLGLVTYFAHGVLNNYSEFDKIAVPLYSFMAILTAIEIKTINDKKDSKE